MITKWLRFVAVCLCGLGVLLIGSAREALATQTVYLNFGTVSLADPADEHVYTTVEKEAIKGLMEDTFAPFDIAFTLVEPPPFTASIVKFNNGFMGGAAEKLDFRNTDTTDDVDVNAKGLLKAFDGTAKAAGGTWTLAELLSSENVVKASANLASHELGHALGLRHHDSFGPLTAGIGVSGSSYDPVWTGPTFSTTAEFHIMGLASTVALSADNLLTPSWLSERSAMKLTFNEVGTVDAETPAPKGAPGLAQDIPFTPLAVPNTTLPPDPFGIDPGDPSPITEFAGFAGAIIGGTLDSMEPVDYYAFDGIAGTIVTIEAISNVIADFDPGRIPDPVDMKIELLTDTLAPLPYPNTLGLSINDDQFESEDAILFDMILPYSGTYFIEVAGSGKMGADGFGEYELYAYGFLPVPEPAGAALLLLGAVALTRRPRCA